MLIFLGVENFAKIEHAKICINSYTLFVGPNNSGKTYLMQLIQGVNERLTELVDEEILKILKHGENQNSNARSYIISQENILQFVFWQGLFSCGRRTICRNISEDKKTPYTILF